MKKFFFLAAFVMGIFSLANAQIIDIIGKGVYDVETETLAPTDLSTIDSIAVHAAYKNIKQFPHTDDVNYSDADESYDAPFQEVHAKLFGSYALQHDVGYFKAVFEDIDGDITMDDLDNPTDGIYAYYAFVYRNTNTTDKYSVIDTNHVFMWHNGSGNPYVYDISVNTSSAPRDMVVKIVLAEINSNELRPNRKAVVNVDAGGVTASLTIDDYNMGKFLNIVEIPLYGVPGSASNVLVSIYSPDPDQGEEDGDSFIVGGVVVDVDKECGECDGKLTNLDLEYLGEDADEITVYSKKGKDLNIVQTFNDVKTGDVLRLVGNDDKGTLGTEVRIFKNEEDESTNIHTSCSQDIFVNMIFGEYRVDAGISRNGGPICTTVPPEDDGEECGECDGQITYLELEYQGSETDATIKVYKDKVKSDKLLATFDNVNNGDILDFTGTGKHNKMGAKIRITVNGDDENYTEIHTSCSQDIYVGYVYGDYEVIAGTSHEGGPLCEGIQEEEEEECGECDGQITSLDLEYQGDDVDSVNIYKGKVKSDKLIATFYDVTAGDVLSFVGTGKDNKMGSKIRITVNDESNYTEIHTSCSQDIYVNMVFGDYKITAGESKDGGPLCETPPPREEDEDCGECDGKLTTLDLQYSGPDADEITVYKKKVENGNELVTFTDVKSGDILNIVGDDDKGTMGTEIRIVVGESSDYTAIHTSCSQDIYVGYVYDDYEVVAGTSRNGGPLCEDPDKSSLVSGNGALTDLSIYPNPVSISGTIQFKAAIDGQATVEIYNIYGQKAAVLFDGVVQADANTVVTFNTESLNKGIYLIVVRNGSQVMTQKIIVGR